ncbi:MAG: carboxypeptidase regulatory-like domain-containing protein, partial [Bacteroidota bacterium]|nr:carboxypeptidase regulatory-like domain-containing protein [Bacteroidota bacterium]
MKQIHLICFIVLFICTVKQSNAQALTISGIVLNHNKKPIDHAIVLLQPLNKVAATDANGHFSFLNLLSGKYAIKVMDANFPSITYKDFTLVRDTFFRVVLEDNIIEHQEIIVTGTSIASERRMSPTPIHAIGLKAMLEQSSLNIIDAISKVPGVNQVTTGPSISKPIIRGLGYNRIVTLQDGVRQEGQQWGDE